MWPTMLIAAALFAGMIAILAIGYQQSEREKDGKAAAVLANAPATQPGRCMLCNAPLRRPSTSDEVVFEIEHRIDSERQAIEQLLRASADGFTRLYNA